MYRTNSIMRHITKFALLLLGTLSIAALGGAAVVLPEGQVSVPYVNAYDGVTGDPIPFVIVAPGGTVFSATGLPDGISINQASGALSGTPGTPGRFSGSISLTTTDGLSNVFDYTFNVLPAPGTYDIIQTETGTPVEYLDAIGTVGVPFGPFPIQTNAPAGAQFSLNIGELPQGLSFDLASNSIRTMEGAPPPSSAGVHTVPLSVNNPWGTGPETLLTITIIPSGDVPEFTEINLKTDTAPLISGYEYQIVAESETEILQYSAIGLPVGLSFDPVLGTIAGIPTAPGVYQVILNAENEYGISNDFLLTLIVGDLSIVNSAAFQAFAGIEFFDTISASSLPLSFNASGLPDGFIFDGLSGTLSGTPTAEGTFAFFVSANNALGEGPEAQITINVGTPTEQGAGNSHMAIVRVRESPSSGGRVTGSRSAPIGQYITLHARENPGYGFEGWEGQNLGLDSDEMKSPTIRLLVTGNTNLTAKFEPIGEKKRKQRP